MRSAVYLGLALLALLGGYILALKSRSSACGSFCTYSWSTQSYILLAVGLLLALALTFMAIRAKSKR